MRGNRRGQWEVVAATLPQVASCGGEWGKECVHKWVWVWRRGCRHCSRGGSGRVRGSTAMASSPSKPKLSMCVSVGGGGVSVCVWEGERAVEG